jgi:D-alanine-D-alanine ligase
MPPRILVLYNEPVLPASHPDAGAEHDILDTVADTFKILVAAGFETRKLGINHDPQPLLDEIKAHRPDAVFNLFEGIPTQPGTEVSVAALLEWLNVPFTGCPSSCLTVGRDKVRAKHLLSAANLPTAPFLVVPAGEPIPRWRRGWPAIVKPAAQDASVGIDQGSVVNTQAELAARVEHIRAAYGGEVLVEAFVFGRELHVNVIQIAGASAPEVLPLAEIEFHDARPGRWPVYTFTAKWDMESDEYKNAPLRAPVYIDPPLAARLEKLAIRAFRLFECRDYARLDVRMTPDGKFAILEMNPNPYLNSLALVNGLMATDRTFEWVVTQMALTALARGGKAPVAGEVCVPVDVVTGV